MRLYKTCTVIVLSAILLLTGCGSADTSVDQASTSNTSENGLTATIDFDNITGDVKPVNGINNGPKSQASVSETTDGNTYSWGLDATDYYEELDIPYVRTHDTEYPYGSDEFVDIHCIFSDFSRDPDDETAYDFTGTDEYIKNILSCGAQVYFRLGESISISTDEILYTTMPEDYDKWASICDHIVSHYNDGWDNGYQYDIKYWQIWNEPDIPRQWNGTLEDYASLYQVTARLLKQNHPDIYVGACACADAEEENVQTFLDAITSDGESTPLDFYAWHIYNSDPSKYDYRANVVKDTLDKNNYTDTQVFLDEWNYVTNWEDMEGTFAYITSADIVSYYAACLINIQTLPVDGAMYYDGALTSDYAHYCGLYNSDGQKLPGYYAFLAFAKLKELKHVAAVNEYDSLKEQGIYVMAASGDSDSADGSDNGADAILIANNNDQDITFNLNSNSDKSDATYFIVDSDHPDGVTKEQDSFSNNETIEMSAHEMLLITLK